MSQKPEDVLDSFRAQPHDGVVSDFYGVQIPGSTERSPVVLHKLPAQKTLVSVSPQIQFKKFRSYTDASKFSQFQLAVAVDGNMKKLVEPRSVFPSPTADDRERFCEALKTGDCGVVRTMLWKNPRLLIGGDDSTQFYKGTWRQTPLHMVLGCEREDLRFALFRTIMEVAENQAFVESTQSTPHENISQRCQMLITSMLNNRNKRSEAVLDCAVAARLVEIVDFLVVHPLSSLALSHRTPAQWKILAESKTAKGDVKGEKSAQVVVDMVIDRFYVPVFARSELFPGGTLGNPLPVERMQEALRDGIVEAFFGPAKEKVCLQFRSAVSEILAREGRKAVLDGRSASPVMTQGQGDGSVLSKERKLYEACRIVARQCGGVWKEWWSILGTFVDRTSRLTLIKLEELFAERRTGFHEPAVMANPICLTRNLDLVEALSICYTKSYHASEAVPVFDPSKDSEMYDDSTDIFYTPPSSPVFGEPFLGQLHFGRFACVFLGGVSPSSVDYFIYGALKDTVIPEDLLYLVAWKSAVMVEQSGAQDLIGQLDQLRL